jgi:hypothetical protein
MSKQKQKGEAILIAILFVLAVSYSYVSTLHKMEGKGTYDHQHDPDMCITEPVEEK